MTRPKSDKKESDGKEVLRPLPLPFIAVPSFSTKKPHSSTSQPTAADGKFVGTSREMVIQMTSTCDRRSKQTVRKHDLNNNDPYLVKFHRNGPQSKIRKAPKVYDYPCSLVMARENPRRSQHKKVATPEDLPATGMTVSLGGTQVTSEPHFTSGASLASDASIDDTLSAPAFGPHGKIIEGSVLGKRSRRDIDDRLEEQDERGEADMLGENALDSPIVEDSRSSGRNDILEEMSPDETCARNNGSSFEPGILMKEHVVLDHATALYPIASETQRITSYHTSPVSMRGEESDSTEAAGLTTADTSEEPQTPDPLTWRPAHGVTAIGVHSFNMPFDDLRKMILLQALEQSQKRQPQSSNKIRALFVSAVTDEQTAPESYTFEHARVKLQAGRNAVYGIQLKERMASLRMFAPNAMQESREVVDGLTAAVHEAREELAAARKALDGDIEIYATVKQELKNIIGVFISEADIPAIEEDALRRYNMISEINAAIVKYGNIWWSQTVRKEREVELEHWIERLEQQTGNGSGNDAFPAGCWAHSANMQSETPDSRQFLTPAPTPPFNMTAPKTYAAPMHKSKISSIRRLITTSRDLTIFEPRLLAIMPQAVARDLISTMRLILTLGGRKRRLLGMWKQNINDMLQNLGNNKAIRVYNEFATAHNQVEKRSTFKLPLIEEPEDGNDEVKESGGESDYHSAQEELEGKETAADGVMQDEVGLEVVQDPHLEMEDLLSVTQQVFAVPDVDTEIAPSPSLPEAHASSVMPVGVPCDKHIDGLCMVVSIQNPEAFPLTNIQGVQAEYYPSTSILDMQVHHDHNERIIQVTATLDKGPVDQLVIHDPRIITLLGLRQPQYAMICLQPNPRIDETYQIGIQPGQRLWNAKAWSFGELVSARHAYLYWLDSKRTSDPRAPPTVAEARLLAPRLGRRAGDVWREIEKVWNLEQGSGGRHFRENRMEYLGEDPEYGGGEERRSQKGMWV
ncbi:hypothetical protein AG0111_0g12161 [Alternaria gaisen]|uniref:Uncharacterized protein n=1 Tax=Alternaria gaisen TaxID=167740 RepID=A0ACB6F5M8_9PLEO|nr:hypothetical protein AG0111_0g12161 [Alternaria gaisen]